MDGHVEERDERQQYLQREQFKQQNPLFRGESTGNEEATELGSADPYEEDEQNNYLHQGSATNYNYAYVSKPNDLDNHEYLEQNSNYLMGSMVQYMMPDGTPVKEKIFVAPADDDREDMTMGHRKMPTMQQLYDSIKTMDEEPKIIMEMPPPSTTAQADEATASSRTIRTLYGNYRIH